MIELKNNPAGNFFLLAGPCVIEGEDMAMRIAERVVAITDKLQIPYVFKGSYRKANRSRLDSFMGIGDEKALKILKKVHDTFGVPTVTDIHAVFLLCIQHFSREPMTSFCMMRLSENFTS